MTTIYHNPRCSKSRETLKLLEEKGITPSIELYLETPPSPLDIQKLLDMLNLAPRDLMRTKESIYKELDLKNEDDNDKLIQAMASNPKLIERPIVVHNGKAALGRPPEQVLELF
ncbi:arsenate reductase (glutaredoxin) [Marinomonas mediterranea]|uniref:arsenate reductase (glutaredoxin) n=1 Tax=Marinomonas mediterranea TaxID=119864 RepID=UPI00234B2A48|nr:arsenate reductase (glutaredoxin) [Marinomonas mediterranea]WCN13810.1 arsenate reductase (glutaredoxin) [Marinomonas mediterranea]